MQNVSGSFLSKNIYHWVAKKFWVGAIFLLVTTACYISVGRYLVSNVDNYSSKLIESINSETPFTISVHRISGIWRGLTPELIISDAKIDFKKDFFSPVEVDQVRLSFNPIASLFAQSPRFYEIKIHGASARQDLLKSKPLLFKMFFSKSSFDSQWIKRIFLNIRKISFIDSVIDLRFGNSSANLFGVNFELKRSGTKHQAQIIVSLDQERVFEFVASGAGNPYKLDSYYGDLYFFANLEPHKSITMLHDFLLPTRTFNSGRIESWFSITPENLDGQVEFLLRDFQLAYNGVEFKIPAERFSGLARIHRSDHNWKIDGLDLLIDSGESSISIQESSFSLNKNNITATISSVDVNSLTAILQNSIALSEEFTEFLSKSKPSGELKNLILTSNYLDLGSRSKWSAKLHFDNLEIESWNKSPAFRNATGMLRMSQEGGSLLLSSEDFSLWFPKIYEDFLYYESFEAKTDIQWDDDVLYLNSGSFTAIGEEGLGSGIFELRIPDREDSKGVELNLQVGMKDANLDYLDKYLSIKVHPSAKSWLKTALRSGDLDDLGFLWRGSLKFDQREHRTMQFFANFSNLNIKFNSNWPEAKELSGLVLLDDREVSIWTDNGIIENIGLDFVSAELFPVPSEGYQLELATHSDTDAGDFLSLVNQTLMSDLSRDAFRYWSIEGETSLTLGLQMDVSEGFKSLIVDADAVLRSVDAHVRPGNIEIDDINGIIRYDPEFGFASSEIIGSLWGNPLAFNLNSWVPNHEEVSVLSQVERIGERVKGVRGDFITKIELSKLANWLETESMAFAEGSTEVELVLRVFPGMRPTFNFNSRLEGVTLDLPKPWGKAPEKNVELRGFWMPQSSVNIAHLWLESGLSFDVALGEKGFIGSNLKFLKPQLNLGNWIESAWLESRNLKRYPDEGKFTISGSINSLDVDEWKLFYEKYFARDLEALKALRTAGITESRSTIDFVVDDLEISHLLFFGLSVNSLNLDYWKTRTGHFFRNDSHWMKGVISLNDKIIKAHLDKIDFSELSSIDWPTNTPGIHGQNPKIEVTIDEILKKDFHIGSLAFVLESSERALTVSDIKGNLIGLAFDTVAPASLSTSFENEGKTRIFANLKLEDLAYTFDYFGYEPFVMTDNGTANLDISWQGGIRDFKIRDSIGEIKLNLGSGSFLEVSSGASNALRIISILDLVDLLDQLSLAHIFDSGVPFNRLTTDLNLEASKIEIPVFEMSGSGSAFSYTGEIDLSNGGDLIGDSMLGGELIVTLPVAKNLPWIAGLAAGSAFIPVATGVYVASKLFESDVDRFSSGIYAVSGTLNKPIIELNKVFDNSSNETKILKKSDIGKDSR
ncbi:MAG: DUF3971 domain-containing protein [Halieaceae bacterium]|nr:DUF3971 domain-containing protein [Halieaceae bacterium]